MNNSDERDYAEEKYNRAEMDREAQKEYEAEQAELNNELRKSDLRRMLREIIELNIEAAKMWEAAAQATRAHKDDEAQHFARMWANKVTTAKGIEADFKQLLDI